MLFSSKFCLTVNGTSTTFDAAKTLSAGKHKIRFEFNTGSVEAYFTVKDKENSSQTESANTGVQNKYGLWIVLLLVAAGGLAGFGILSKRRKNHK